MLGIEYFKTEYAKQCSKLRCMLYGGEPLPMELVKLTYNEVSRAAFELMLEAHSPCLSTCLFQIWRSCKKGHVRLQACSY